MPPLLARVCNGPAGALAPAPPWPPAQLPPNRRSGDVVNDFVGGVAASCGPPLRGAASSVGASAGVPMPVSNTLGAGSAPKGSKLGRVLNEKL